MDPTLSERSTPPPNPAGTLQYWAFISYSHRDERWANWLHSSLETYRVPRPLTKRTTPLGPISRRLFPIFRDRDELGSAPDLGAKIKNALDSSRYLIVVCSPNSAKSNWVNEEIKHFKSQGRDDRVLCLIVDGEPGARLVRGQEQHECFPSAVCCVVTPGRDLTTIPLEPLAADARAEGDGKKNAVLKLLAGMLCVSFDELKQRERRRRARRRAGWALLGILAAAAATLGFVALADVGVRVPGAQLIQLQLDRRAASVFRPVPPDSVVLADATMFREKLAAALTRASDQRGYIVYSLKPGAPRVEDYCAHAQSEVALLKLSQETDEPRQATYRSIEAPFFAERGIDPIAAMFGERPTTSSPSDGVRALWIVSMLAKALQKPKWLSKPDEQHVRDQLAQMQIAMRHFQSSHGHGGWNMFPNSLPEFGPNAYSTVLALMTLLEHLEAQVEWEQSTARRDQLLREAADWLVANFDGGGELPGWHGTGENEYEVFDGLTLQCYAALFRAHMLAGTPLPKAMFQHATRHLISCVNRDLDFPVASGEFEARIQWRGAEYHVKEAYRFLWYPWALETMAWWQRLADEYQAAPEEIVRVRRARGHLVVEAGPPIVDRAAQDWTFIAAETLYGLASVEPARRATH